MTKFTVTKFGEILDPAKYSWDEETKTFRADHDYLVLDFTGGFDITFITGACCIFKTESRCTFHTRNRCIFDALHECTFHTGSECMFETGLCCTFETGSSCVFKTSGHCTFKTGLNSVVINRVTGQVTVLNEVSNYYNMDDNFIQLENIIVFKNKDDLNISLPTIKLDKLRHILGDEKCNNILREIFDKLV